MTRLLREPLRAGERVFCYARVLEEPSCPWSTWNCNALGPADRPPACAARWGSMTIQERAWSSPIWHRPE